MRCNKAFHYIRKAFSNLKTCIPDFEKAVPVVLPSYEGAELSKKYFNLIPYFGGKYGKLGIILPYIEKVAQANNAHTYVECFGGGGKCILNLDTLNHTFKNKIYNEWDTGLCSLFKIASSTDTAIQLSDTLARIDYTIDAFAYAKKHKNDKNISELDQAGMIFLTCIMSFNSNMRDYKKIGYDYAQVSKYYNDIDRIKYAPCYLNNVMIVNGDYRDIMKTYGKDPRAVKYLDPPYHPASREKSSLKVYPNELTVDQHKELVNILCNSRAWILSGYDPAQYGSNDYKPLEEAGAIKVSLGRYTVTSSVNLKGQKEEFLWYKL